MLRRGLIWLAALLSCCGASRAQDTPIDSLSRALAEWSAGRAPATDTIGVSLVLKLAMAFQDVGEVDSALVAAERAIGLADEGLAATGGTDRARWLDHALVAQRMKGAQLFFLGRYPESLESVKRYLALAEELGSRKDIGAAYNYMSYCYTALEDAPSALSWSRKALAEMQGSGGQDLANAYVGMAGLHFDLGQTDSGVVCLREALRLHAHIDEPDNRASALCMMAEAFLGMGNVDSVRHYMARLQDAVQAGVSRRLRMRFDLIQGQVALQAGRVAEALALLERADSTAVAMEDHRQRHYIGRYRSIGHAMHGDWAQAVAMADLSAEELKQDLGLEKVRALAAAEATAAQERALVTATLNAEAYRKSRWLAWSAAGGGAAIALLLGLLYAQSRRNARKLAEGHAALVAAQDELMRVEQQRAAEAVRTRVARDIHDELGGSLSKIALLSDLAGREGSPAEERAQRLRAMADHARQVRGSLNDVVWATDPKSDRVRDLLEHIADRAYRLLDGTGVELRLDLHAHDPATALGPAFKRDLSMVVKEALNNALKHARPRTITVRFHVMAGHWELCIADDGRGLGHSPVDGGNGLVNMRTRVAAHGGTLSVHPAANGVGTMVDAHGPL